MVADTAVEVSPAKHLLREESWLRYPILPFWRILIDLPGPFEISTAGPRFVEVLGVEEAR